MQVSFSSTTYNLVVQVELFCSVECSPLCSISWLREGELILNGSANYSILERVKLADYATNTLSQVVLSLLRAKS
jgi:hypothetical protein